jgi:hypothetical protein
MRFEHIVACHRKWGRDGARRSNAMRLGLIIGLCLLFGGSTYAQEQERKLVDRLLEPNTKLENSEQHKQFTGAGTMTAKSASARSFYVSNKELSKTFADTRQFTTRSYSSRQFGTKDATLPPSHKTGSFATTDARGISTARDASRTYGTRQFAGNRPFLAQGKSQKALHAQDRPLSIDDVRELLNKNK